MQKTFRNILVEYGVIAVVIYFAIFFLVWIGFWAAMTFGWSPTNTVANMGTWVAAYIATKITQPLRIAATLALTPIVKQIYGRLSKDARTG